MKNNTARRSVIAGAATAGAWLLTVPIAWASLDVTPVPSLVVSPVNANDTVTLAGNTYPMATVAADQGLVSSTQQLGSLFIVLRRSATQESALAAFNTRQLDSNSPDYHHWLQPQEFGLKYGPNDADISAVTSWLKTAGLQVQKVSEGRIAIEFSGTAAQIQEAFGVQMHRYLVDGTVSIANDRDPQIPRALSPAIAGVVGLNTVPVKSVTPRGAVTSTAAATSGAPVSMSGAPASSASVKFAAPGARPGLSYQDGPYQDAFVTPYDFATIYNSLPLWNASKPITGSGVTIAVVSDNDVKADDITTYQSTFGLRINAPTIELVGSNPGGSSEQGTVELEMASAAAPGATLKLVVPEGGLTAASVLTAVNYTVDKNLASIVVFPYFACERLLGSSSNALINGYWQQGATQGMSIVVATGDFGSAGCNNSGGPDATAGPQGGLEVNGFASSPFVTAVGGTDFAWQWGSDKFSTYWKAPSSPIQYESAKGYIPEVPWNTTCTNALLLQGQDYLIEDTTDGHLPDYTTTQNLCSANYNNSYYKPLLHSIGSGGGASNCSAVDSGGICNAAYAKPDWQKGTGVPADGKRDLPDVSLFASGGWLDVQQYGVEFDPPTPIIPSTEIVICYSGGSPSHACTYDTYAGVAHQTAGGTGAAAAYWAGILALVEQKQGGGRQGLVNPTLYNLFRAENLGECKATSVTAGNTCVFYDISTAVTNGMACVPGSSANCYVIPGSTGEYETTFGILDGYTAGVGYDQTTGLGSVNITNLVDKWPSSSSASAALSLSATSLAFGNEAAGSSSTSKSVTLTNSGSASLTLSSIALTGQADDFVLSKTCDASLSAAASCTISIAFKPVSTGSKVASVSITDNASGSPQSITLTGTGTAAGSTPAVKLSATSLAFGNQAAGSSSASKSVTLTNSGSGSLTLSSITLTGQADDFVLSKTCGASLSAGASCSLLVAFKPVSSGSKVASISISDNASGSPQSIALTGTGTAAGSAPAATLSPTSLSFGSQAAGSSSAAKSVTLINSGSATLSLSSIAVTGAQADDFVLSKTCGATLSAGAKCAISVVFKPVSAGSKAASVTITDNASSSKQSIALTGTGT